MSIFLQFSSNCLGYFITWSDSIPFWMRRILHDFVDHPFFRSQNHTNIRVVLNCFGLSLQYIMCWPVILATKKLQLAQIQRNSSDLYFFS